jgi:hypothetical protein
MEDSFFDMEDNEKASRAESLPFSRRNMADVLQIPHSRLNNWLDKNKLWQTLNGPKLNRYYTLREVFDLGGFSAMRLAKIPESHCASYIYNFGFIRSFWLSPQETRFNFRTDGWSLGSYDPNALLSITINVRTLGENIFCRIAELSSTQSKEWPEDTFEYFRALYSRAVELDRVSQKSAPLFDAATTAKVTL